MSELTGRELDAEVAEKVLGLEIFSREWPCIYFKSDETWEVAPEDYRESEPNRWGGQTEIVWKFRAANTHGPEYSSLHRVDDYSTDWNAASLVVEKMRGKGAEFKMQTSPEGWHCLIWLPPKRTCISAASLPEAICRAAVAACEAIRTWQDTAGTVPAVADGDPIGRWEASR